MNIIGTWTLFRKEIQRFIEVWTQTLAAPVVSNLLFFVIFGVAMAGRDSGFDGLEYLQILVPGLVAMGIMNNAFGNPLGSIMIGKYTNAINELLMWPFRGYEIVLSYVAAAILRGMIVGGITLIVGSFFTEILFTNIPMILLMTVLMGTAFASFGAIVGVIAKTFDQSAMIQNFVMQPLIFLGGVFFSLSQLDGVMLTIARWNPLLYMIDGFRYGFIGQMDTSIGMSIGVSATVAIALFLAASWMFNSGYKLKS
jgi:ABC-2 type transport system permease protein